MTSILTVSVDVGGENELQLVVQVPNPSNEVISIAFFSVRQQWQLDSDSLLQSLGHELERVYKEENFPPWHFQSFSRCSSQLLNELKESKREKGRETGMLAALRNVSTGKIQSCLTELSFQLHRTRNEFPWSSVDSAQNDKIIHNFSAEVKFAAFSTAMRDRFTSPYPS
jgi:hypothetical protein